MNKKPFYRHLYFQVLIAIVLGIFVGSYFPAFGAKLKPLGDAFIKLIKMVVAPIIFTTVVVGMAGMGSFKRVGRVGAKALLYFEVMTTLALAIGYVVVKWLEPGVGVNADPAKLDAKAIASYVTSAKTYGFVDFMVNVIPSSVVDAFAKGDIIQVLFFSILFGLALAGMGNSSKPIVQLLDKVSDALLKVIGMIIKLAPFAAFGAIAYTTASFGTKSIAAQLVLMACVYTTSLLFVLVILGGLMRFHGISIWKFLKYIREEVFIVLGTASSESVLPRMMNRLEQLGCSKPIVRLVLPAGYSFNMDGSCIYLTMAAIFIAQATNANLTIGQELTVILVCLITSKGAAGVTGGGFISLAATLSAMNTIPIEGMVLILGIDRLMSEARSVTNLIGNGVATVLVSKWENEFDSAKCDAALNSDLPPASLPYLVDSSENTTNHAAEELHEHKFN